MAVRINGSTPVCCPRGQDSLRLLNGNDGGDSYTVHTGGVGAGRIVFLCRVFILILDFLELLPDVAGLHVLGGGVGGGGGGGDGGGGARPALYPAAGHERGRVVGGAEGADDVRDEGLLQLGQLGRRAVHEGADGEAQAGLLVTLPTPIRVSIIALA